MKKLLLFLLLALTTNVINAQLTCANATTISANGTFVCPAITGTYPATGSCWTTPAAKAIWYKFTPTSSGLITVDAGISPNSTSANDTRMSILTGTCSSLTCEGGNDDIVGNSDYGKSVLESGIVG